MIVFKFKNKLLLGCFIFIIAFSKANAVIVDLDFYHGTDHFDRTTMRDTTLDYKSISVSNQILSKIRVTGLLPFLVETDTRQDAKLSGFGDARIFAEKQIIKDFIVKTIVKLPIAKLDLGTKKTDITVGLTKQILYKDVLVNLEASYQWTGKNRSLQTKNSSAVDVTLQWSNFYQNSFGLTTGYAQATSQLEHAQFKLIPYVTGHIGDKVDIMAYTNLSSRQQGVGARISRSF